MITDVRNEFYVKSNNNDVISYFALYEATKKDQTLFITEGVYPIVEKVLSTSDGDKKYRLLIKNFLDRNASKLHTPGPVYMIAFMDSDKKNFYDLFNTTDKEILTYINKYTSLANDKADWKLVKQNPHFCLIYECIRYYTIHKDKTGINASLMIYALAVYPSVFHKYFRFEPSAEIMAYTIDNLSSRFMFKQNGNLMNTLLASIQNSYDFLKDDFITGYDIQISRFISRIRNDQNSLLKNIRNEFTKNYEANKRIITQNDTYSDNELIDDQLNDTSAVEDISRRITQKVLSNGVDLTRAAAAAKIANVSVSDLRFYLTKIITHDKNQELYAFIEAILFIYLYQENHKVNQINEMQFLSFGMELFRRTNSNDKNVVTIKEFLTKWSEETGIMAKYYKRVATQINYKRGLFTYFILCIQYYNQ